MDSRRYNRALAQFHRLWLVCDPQGTATCIDDLTRPKGTRKAVFERRIALLNTQKDIITSELRKDAQKWYKKAYLS